MPKRSRSQRFMQGIEGSHSKQPRPLEDGNWVCEDPDCENVNYPRRTKCNKCGKSRGPVGDAVVDAYNEKLKAAKGELPHPVTAPSSVKLDGAPDPSLGAFEHTRFNMNLGMLPSGSSFINGYNVEPLSLFGSQYITQDQGQISTLSAATHGKRLAEHLVASFATSLDPIRDASEVLNSAILWLQNMKSKSQVEGGLSLLLGSPAFGGLSMPLGNGALNVASQSQLGWSTGSSDKLGIGNMLTQSNSSVSGFHGARASLGGSARWEDYKDRPSDFLKEFGDPVAIKASAVNGGTKPEPGVNGNWECEECKNVNFPRRTACYQCRKKRGTKGDEVVEKYVSGLFEKMSGM